MSGSRLIPMLSRSEPGARLGLAVGGECVRVGSQPAGVRVGPALVDLALHRVDRPPAEAALHRGHNESRLSKSPGIGLEGGLMKSQYTEVGRNRVEAAGVDDAGSALLSRSCRPRRSSGA